MSGGQGTSFATALTAGVAALWLGDRRPKLIQSLVGRTVLQEVFRKCLQMTARRPANWDGNQFGAGIVDAERLVSSGCGIGPNPAATPSGRENYRAQIADVCSSLSSAPEQPRAVDGLMARLQTLRPEDLEFFAHEALTLLSQDAWLTALGREPQIAAREHSLPILAPSRLLRSQLGL